MKDVTIVIINYNTAKFTLECIDSIYRRVSKTIDFEIIVIDNNSKLEDFQYLKTNLNKKDNLLLHRSPINTGFGGGNMLGVQFASPSKYCLFLNNDTQFKNDCLSLLFNYMESNTTVGVATAQNFDENNNHVISFDHNKSLKKLIFGRHFLESYFPKKHPKRKIKYTKPVAVNFVNGAFMFFRNSAFTKVGGFDTNIFLYFEEMDICSRIKNIGFSSVLFPEAEILHYQGKSTGVSRIISQEGFLSFLYVYQKQNSVLQFMLLKAYYVVTFIFKPKKWHLLKLLVLKSHISNSLKQKQNITNII